MVLSGPRPIVAPDFVTSNVERDPRSVSRRNTSPTPEAGAVTGGASAFDGAGSATGATCAAGVARTAGAAATAGRAPATAAIVSTRGGSRGAGAGLAETGASWTTTRGP